MGKLREQIKGKELKIFSVFTMILLFVTAFLLDTPADIGKGMITIVLSRDTLITDYFELACYGAAFFNAGLIMASAIFMMHRLKMHFTGLTMAVLFINVGFALFGKNPINVLPIIIGTWLYAKFHKAHMSRYIYTALFGSCLSPLVTEMGYLLPFSPVWNFVLAIVIGIFVGFILPPLAMHTASMHMGYNLLNMGFAAGMLAFVIVCVLQSHGLVCNSVFIWKEGRPLFLIIGLYGYFLLTALYGFWLNGKSLKGMKHLLKHPGRAVADFVMMDGEGTTLMNMGAVGVISLTYILLVKGDLSGPVIGTILTAFGFSAFGVHVKNFPPVLLGVYLSTFFSNYTPDTPGIQLAAIFAAGLAPIAGQFGILAGIIAGMMHASVSMCTSALYGGLNLYNNGFSTGLVAIVMVPMLESFMSSGFVEEIKKKKADRKK
ncbi:MAG: DUF1576 domain-containing protein [Lachnospiraceae bacterium]|nr:DUF1576 domain-containing protein [Lachnospiraceae bacterium]MBQ9927993.1 DUF1576 domain-containing protein [Lachnospiraceae bacterium]